MNPSFRTLPVKLSMSVLFAGLMAPTGWAGIKTEVNGERQPAYQHTAFNKIMVTALVKPQASKEWLEKEVASQMTKRGFDAVPSMDFFDAQKIYSERGVKEAYHLAGVDAVLVIDPLEVDSKKFYVPNVPFGQVGGYSKAVYVGKNARTGGYYLSKNEHAGPGEYGTFEIRLVDTSTEKLAWLATLQVEGPKKARQSDYVQTIVHAIIRKLNQDHLLVQAK